MGGPGHVGVYLFVGVWFRGLGFKGLGFTVGFGV